MACSSQSRRWSLLVSVFLVSFAVLAFEVGLTRIFAALLSYHFAFLAVSAAVCGLGIGGLLWHILGQWEGFPRPGAGWTALGFALSMPFTIFLLFGAAGILAVHPMAALLVILPFTFSGAFLADVFQQRAEESGRLYQADLAGAAIAAVLVVPLLGLSGALYLVFLLAGMAAVGAAAWACAQEDGRVFAASAAFGLLLFALWPLGPRINLFRVRPFAGPAPNVAKRMLSELADESTRPLVIDSEWTAYARTDLVRYPLPDYGAYTLQLFTDGETPSVMMPFRGDLEGIRFLKSDLPYLAFEMSPRGRLLSIGPGGGMDFLWGLLAGFEWLEGVEINDSVGRLMERHGEVNGDLYHHPRVAVTTEDGRSYVRRVSAQYDLISSSLTQTATIGNVGLSLVESYIHTKEAFDDYFRHLTPNGRYALVCQSQDLLWRGALTALDVMRDHGIEVGQGCRHLMALGLPEGHQSPTPYRYLLLWKRSPMTSADLALARDRIAAGAAAPLFLPGGQGSSLLRGIEGGELDLDRIFAAGVLFEGVRANLRPATDDRPFFLDLSFDIPGFLEWLFLASGAVVLIYSSVFLVRRGSRRRPVRGWLLYFAALGTGFMMIEIPLIQKLVLFLGHPTTSLAAILLCLLGGASLGSQLSQRWHGDGLARCASYASLLVVVGIALHLVALPSLLALFQPAHLAARLLLLALSVLPLGVALGVPFPSGIRLMASDLAPQIPWMWGVNGVMSVMGSTLAAVGAKFIGFSGCLIIGAAIYGAVAVGLLRFSGPADMQSTGGGSRRRRPRPRRRRRS